MLREQPWPSASDDMMAALDSAARAASAAMARVRDVALPPVLAGGVPGPRAPSRPTRRRARSPPSTSAAKDEARAKGMLELVESGFAISADAYDDARRIASQARGALADLMADIDVILSPSAPGAAPKGLTSTGNSTFNRLWTLMGTPCVNVPGLADHNGLPLGDAGDRPVRQRPGDPRGGPVR